jgi:PhnB protein
MAKTTKAVPDGYHTITPQLTLDNATRTIEWYKKTLNAEEISRSVAPDGTIMHAELKVGDSRFMVGDAMGGAKSPKAVGGSPSSLWVYTENCDAFYNRALDGGAKVHMQLADQFWGDRAGAIVDPSGHIWWFATHVEDVTPTEMTRRAAEFFRQQEHQATAR